MSDRGAESVEATPGKEARARRQTLICLALLALLALAACVGTLDNTAQFHHVPNPFGDPVLDNTILKSWPLFPKIFSGEFLLTTTAEYRPVGYAFFAVLNNLLPNVGTSTWHVLLIGLHLASAIILFLMLRMLLGHAAAFITSAIYLAHPIFVPLLNDLNLVYLLWGLLLSLLTAWPFLLYLRSRKALYLLVSFIAFGLSVFTYRHAVILPVHLIVLCLYHDRSPRATASALVYLSLVGLLAGLLNVQPLLALGLLAVLVIASSGAAALPKTRYLELAKLLWPYLVIIGFGAAVSASVRFPEVIEVALDHSRNAKLVEPSQLRFVSKCLLSGSTLSLIALTAAGLVPVALIRRPPMRVLGVILLALSFLATARDCRKYRDSVTYWQNLNEVVPNHRGVQVNLARAYLDAGKYGPARDLLMWLRYGARASGPGETVVSSMLGETYAGLGNDKVAGMYFFSTMFSTRWNYEIMKNLLAPAGAFCFRLGYLSTAEFCWASALVIDPCDVRFYNYLGKVLVYKNFFRAAEKHFRHVLSLQPGNQTALYYLSFIAKLGGGDHDFRVFSQRWREATGTRGEMDFAPVYAAYDFDRDKMVALFSDNPSKMLSEWKVEWLAKGQAPGYVVEYEGKTYNFFEVALEIGKFFMGREDYRAALAHLEAAYKASPQSRDVIELLVVANRRLGRAGEAERYEQLLETPSKDAATD